MATAIGSPWVDESEMEKMKEESWGGVSESERCERGSVEYHQNYDILFLLFGKT